MNRRVKYIVYVIDGVADSNCADMINTVAISIFFLFLSIDMVEYIYLNFKYRGKLKGLLSRCGESKLTTVR